MYEYNVYYLSISSSYKSTVEDDLFAALDNAAKADNTLDHNLNVHTIFGSWSNQKGYPLLTVERDYQKGTVTLKQSRYISPKTNSTDATTWWIPYNYATASNSNFDDTKPDGWLSQKTKELSGNWSSNDWILFNKQQTGFYRVLYDENNYKLLAKQLNSDNYTAIHPINRAQIIDDAFEFAQQGLLKWEILFDLLSYLERETDFAPWWSASTVINSIKRPLSAGKESQKFIQFVAKITGSPFNKIGLEDVHCEPHFKKYTRQQITSLACSHGAHGCLNATYTKLKEVLYNGQSVSPNQIGYLFEEGIRSATDEEVNLLWQRCSKSKNSAEVGAIAESFGSIKNHSLIEFYLNKTSEPSPNPLLTKHDKFHMFNGIMMSGQHAVSSAIRLVKERPLQFKENLNNLNTIVNSIARRIFSHKIHHEVCILVRFFHNI